jgi:hypothetical protein
MISFRVPPAALMSLLLLLAACASTQVNEESSDALEEQRMEQSRKQLEDEERNRQAILLEAQRTRAEAERRREEERRAEERRAELARAEERRLAEIRRQEARAEEERRASMKNEENRKAEEERRAEAARIEAEKKEEQRRVEEERRRLAEEKRRTREALLEKTDPDRASFFRREMEEALEDLDCSAGRHSVHLYRNKRPLQFSGGNRDLESADVDRPVTVNRLSRAVRGPGNYVPLLGEGRNLELVECRAGSLVLRLLNIRADGLGNYWLLLEDQKGFVYTVLREDLDLGPEAN